MNRNMKVITLILLVLFIVTPAHAAGIVLQVDSPVTPEQIMLGILYVSMVFATLPGVSLLSAAITNTLKAFGKLVGFNFDGRADQITAWINLALFGVLLYFRVFSPATSFDWVDERFKLVADTILALSYLFGQLQLQPFSYAALKGKLPVVGTSYSGK